MAPLVLPLWQVHRMLWTYILLGQSYLKKKKENKWHTNVAISTGEMKSKNEASPSLVKCSLIEWNGPPIAKKGRGEVVHCCRLHICSLVFFVVSSALLQWRIYLACILGEKWCKHITVGIVLFYFNTSVSFVLHWTHFILPVEMII